MTTRYSRLSLAIGVVLALISSLFHPGTVLINPVYQIDFSAAAGAIGEAPVLSHLMTIMQVLSMLLMSFGLLGLYQLATRQGGLAEPFSGSAYLSRSSNGAALSSVWECGTTSPTSPQRMAEVPDGSEQQTELQNSALTIYINMAAVLVVFVTLCPFA